MFKRPPCVAGNVRFGLTSVATLVPIPTPPRHTRPLQPHARRVLSAPNVTAPPGNVTRRAAPCSREAALQRRSREMFAGGETLRRRKNFFRPRGVV